MVVVAIIAILAAILMPALSSARERGKATGMHYDGHVSMLDVENEFYCSDDTRGNNIFKRYFNNHSLF